jgi:ribose 5-phosphate isomerase A
MKELTQAEIKQALGEKAASLIENGMTIGLGTGSTATCFINSLIQRCRNGLKIQAVSSSNRSLQQAQSGGIPIADINRITQLDLTVDGADEIDPKNRMIKGGGGALAREKILATSSRQMLVIVDETKLVDVLGKFGLPVEIIPFGYEMTLMRIRALGYDGKIRKNSDGNFYITDNENYIFDIHIPQTFSNSEKDHQMLIGLAGVVETGFFFNLPLRVLVGRKDGSVVFREVR